MSRRCIMNCPQGEKLHRFPKDATRRAEWLSLLGVKTSVKNIFVCSRHFSEEYLYGDGISKYAKPSKKSAEQNANKCINFNISESNQASVSLHEQLSVSLVEGASWLDYQLQPNISGVFDFQNVSLEDENSLSQAETVVQVTLLMLQNVSQANVDIPVVSDNFIGNIQMDDTLGDKELMTIGKTIQENLDGPVVSDTIEGCIGTQVSTTDCQSMSVIGSENTDRQTRKTGKYYRVKVLRLRTKYLTEKRLRVSLDRKNLKLSKHLEDYKRKAEKLELELMKKNDLSLKVSKPLSVCIENSLKNHARYNMGLKLISLAVYFLSPIVYRYLTPIFDWPEKRTLQRFVQDWPKSPGNLNGSFEALRVRAAQFSEEEKYISVSCDEMSLKSFVEYNRYTDEIIGLQDFGDENRSRNVATSAMVIMASGIGGNSWSHAVSYFFVHGSCKGNVMLKNSLE